MNIHVLYVYSVTLQRGILIAYGGSLSVLHNFIVLYTYFYKTQTTFQIAIAVTS